VSGESLPLEDTAFVSRPASAEPERPDDVDEPSAIGATAVQKRRKAITVVGALTGHLGMGAGLGTILALSLLVGNVSNIFTTIRNSPDAGQLLLVFVGGFAATFGIGATLTGLIFMEMDRR